jgi:hypothetical protein
MDTNTQTTRLTQAEIRDRYNGRWVLITDFLRDPKTNLWYEAVVLADAPYDDNSSLFRLAKELNLKEKGIIFIGENPYNLNFLL